MAASSSTITLQLQEPISSETAQRDEVLCLRLVPRRKKKVSWQPGTVDNELMQKKSSKKCCIFHKEHEDDSSDDEHHSKSDRKVHCRRHGPSGDVSNSSSEA